MPETESAYHPQFLFDIKVFEDDIYDIFQNMGIPINPPAQPLDEYFEQRRAYFLQKWNVKITGIELGFEGPPKVKYEPAE